MTMRESTACYALSTIDRAEWYAWPVKIDVNAISKEVINQCRREKNANN